MQPIPNDTLLTIIVILAGAISISQFFPYRKEPLYSTFNINRITNILITLIIAFLIVIIFNLAPTNLIDDVLVGLSALLAFAAVVKSIQNANSLEEKKKEEDEKSAMLRLSVYLNEILETFDILKFLPDRNQGAYDDILIKLNEIRDTIEKDTLLFNYVKTNDMAGLLSSLRHTNPKAYKTSDSIETEKSLKASEELILILQSRLTILIKIIASYNNIELAIKKEEVQ